MKKANRIIRTILTQALLFICVGVIILMVHDAEEKPDPAMFSSRGIETDVRELKGLSEESLLNSGTAAELDKLPGIGEVLAERIIDTREQDGLYFFPEDVITVKGIGEKKMEDIKAYLAELELAPTEQPASE